MEAYGTCVSFQLQIIPYLLGATTDFISFVAVAEIYAIRGAIARRTAVAVLRCGFSGAKNSAIWNTANKGCTKGWCCALALGALGALVGLGALGALVGLGALGEENVGLGGLALDRDSRGGAGVGCDDDRCPEQAESNGGEIHYGEERGLRSKHNITKINGGEIMLESYKFISTTTQR